MSSNLLQIGIKPRINGLTFSSQRDSVIIVTRKQVLGIELKC